jgi:hypothetical protein
VSERAVCAARVARCSALWLPAFVLGLAACPPVVSDPPPPPSKPEIVGAPPRALGALAGGTEAAPRPDVTPGALPGLPAVPVPGAPGALPDGGGPTGGDPASPEADAGLPL